MNIDQYYRFLNVSHTATDDEISAAYKKLALKFHPDKNPHRLAWANDAMSKLNVAYAAVMSYRFKDEIPAERQRAGKPAPRRQQPRPVKKPYRDIIDSEILTKQFINLRESIKDELYRYFQYSLYNLPVREKISNRAIFNKMVFSLRKLYHSVLQLREKSDDPEIIEHLDVFTTMVFNFYRASECQNIIDSYSDQYDVEAFRIYRKGDEQLHVAHKEIFYDRHNRGYFKKDMAKTYVVDAEKIFQANLKVFPDSTWSVETKIKLEYVQSLRRYLELFFSED